MRGQAEGGAGSGGAEVERACCAQRASSAQRPARLGDNRVELGHAARSGHSQRSYGRAARAASLSLPRPCRPRRSAPADFSKLSTGRRHGRPCRPRRSALAGLAAAEGARRKEAGGHRLSRRQRADAAIKQGRRAPPANGCGRDCGPARAAHGMARTASQPPALGAKGAPAQPPAVLHGAPPAPCRIDARGTAPTNLITHTGTRGRQWCFRA